MKLIKDALPTAICGVKKLLFRFFNPREYWEERAKSLPRGKYYVGRTDMYSYVEGCYVHYVYSPDESEKRVPFLGNPTSALRRAVKYAEKLNRNDEKDRPYIL
jgi:hypothetical protein